MKSLVVAAASAAALLAVPGLAQAQDMGATSLYGTVGYANFDADDVNLGAIQARLGARFGPYFGVEGEAAFGIDDDSIDTGLAPPLPTSVDVELNHELGLFGVVFLPASENVDLFARVGYVGAEIEASTAGVSDDGGDDGWAFGVGGAFYFDGQNGVRVDYTRHEFGDDLDADVWAVAYSRRF
jgi:hypothetical protein